MDNKKIFIVVQGPMNYWEEISKSLKDFENVIYSTWKTDKKDFDKYFIINRKPITNGIQNINRQVRSSLNGLKYAKKLGATHCLKLRSDMIFSDLNRLFSLLDDESIYFPAICKNQKNPYYVDYFQYGPIQDMIKLWDIPMKFKQFHKMYPEFYITNNFFKKCKKSHVKYFYPICKENDIKCMWLGRNFEVFESFENEYYAFDDIKH